MEARLGLTLTEDPVAVAGPLPDARHRLTCSAFPTSFVSLLPCSVHIRHYYYCSGRASCREIARWSIEKIEAGEPPPHHHAHVILPRRQRRCETFRRGKLSSCVMVTHGEFWSRRIMTLSCLGIRIIACLFLDKWRRSKHRVWTAFTSTRLGLTQISGEGNPFRKNILATYDHAAEPCKATKYCTQTWPWQYYVVYGWIETILATCVNPFYYFLTLHRHSPLHGMRRNLFTSISYSSHT